MRFTSTVQLINVSLYYSPHNQKSTKKGCTILSRKMRKTNTTKWFMGVQSELSNMSQCAYSINIYFLYYYRVPSSSESMAKQFSAIQNQASIGVNVVVSTLTAFGIAYYFASYYSKEQTWVSSSSSKGTSNYDEYLKRIYICSDNVCLNCICKQQLFIHVTYCVIMLYTWHSV